MRRRSIVITIGAARKANVGISNDNGSEKLPLRKFKVS